MTHYTCHTYVKIYEISTSVINSRIKEYSPYKIEISEAGGITILMGICICKLERLKICIQMSLLPYESGGYKNNLIKMDQLTIRINRIRIKKNNKN